MKKRVFLGVLVALFAIVPLLKAVGQETPYAVLVANQTSDADVFMYVYTGGGKQEDCLAPYLSKRFLFQKDIRSMWIAVFAKGQNCKGPALEKFSTSVPDDKGVMMTYKATGKDGRYDISESRGPFHP